MCEFEEPSLSEFPLDFLDDHEPATPEENRPPMVEFDQSWSQNNLGMFRSAAVCLVLLSIAIFF